MMKYQVKTPSDALGYMVDCTMATVGYMATKKSRQKHEYARQIAIAQQGVDWMIGMGVTLSGRAADLNGISVAEWAKRYEL